MIIQTVKITVIIPIYNAGEYLVNCLEAILNQSYTNFEVILINDGSKDNSEEICLSYTAIDNRFHYFYQENKGVSEARNLGIEKCKTKWICFVDPDDSIDVNYIKNFIINISDDKTLLMTDFNRISRNGKHLNILGYKDDTIDLISDRKKLFSDINYLVGNPFNKLYNLDIINNHNIRFRKGQTLGQDRLFYYEYIKYIDFLKLSNSSEYNYYYRENSSITKIHHYDVYLNLIKGENEILNKSEVVANEIKERYTSLFFQYLRSLNKFKQSNEDTLNELIHSKEYIHKKYFLSNNKRMLLLIRLYNLRLYKLMLYVLNQILK